MHTHLLEDNEIVTDNMACVEIFNNFFSNSVSKLAIDDDLHVNKGINLINPVCNIIEKFKEHPSIVSMNQKMFMPNSFSFKSVSENDIICVINNIEYSSKYTKS